MPPSEQGNENWISEDIRAECAWKTRAEIEVGPIRLRTAGSNLEDSKTTYNLGDIILIGKNLASPIKPFG